MLSMEEIEVVLMVKKDIAETEDPPVEVKRQTQRILYKTASETHALVVLM